MNWSVKNGELLKNNINKELSSYEQLAQALRIYDNFIYLSSMSVYDTNVVSYLNQKSLLEINIDDLFSQLKFNKHLKFEQACFAAGTLVHTDKGLVPIQNIRVGDKVLSMPEDKNGELSYKKVISTFESLKKKPIIMIGYTNIDSDSFDDPWAIDNPIVKESFIFLTEDHPIWVEKLGEFSAKDDEDPNEQLGWVLAKNIRGGEKVLFSDGKIGQISTPSCIFYTDVQNVLWLPDNINGLPKFLIDLRFGKINLYFVGHIFNSELYSLKDISGYNDALVVDESVDIFEGFLSYINNLHLRDYRYPEVNVYNIEVDEYHTYFIGTEGLWVHNTNGCFNERNVPSY